MNKLEAIQEMKKSKKYKGDLVYNAIQTPDGTILVSRHVHDDYVTYVDSITNEEYMLDGGTYYIRTNVNKVKAKSLHLYLYDDIKKVREITGRGGYGKPGTSDYGTFRFTLLKDMDDEYLDSAIGYATIKNQRKSAILCLREKQYRNLVLNKKLI